MLQQYSTAIQLLQSTVHRNDKSTITVVLITCQIFTFLEYLRGRYKVAEAHLRNGLKLLRAWHDEDSRSPSGVQVLKTSSHAKAIDKGIIQRFAALHVQADLFGHHLADVNVLLQPLEVEIPFPTFANAEEAKDSLDQLTHNVVILSHRFQENKAWDKQSLSALPHDLQQAEILLATWLETYIRTVSDFSTQTPSTHQATEVPLAFGSRTLPRGVNAREPLAYKLLLNFHTMATIMCKCISLQSELKYEAHSSDFIAILKNAIDVWQTYLLARDIPGNVELANSIGEFGPIPPLYYTAIKCRNHRTRLHAIRLLRVVQCKEGIWESFLAANIATKVMQLEEQGFYSPCRVDDDFPLVQLPTPQEYSLPPLPEANLFHDVQVDMQDDPESRAVLTCKRWRVDGSLEIVRYRFFGEHGCESMRLQ